jgi:hypothetical protein
VLPSVGLLKQLDFTDIATNRASSNTGVATVASAYTTLVGGGNATGSAHLQLEGTNYRLNCPLVAFVPQSHITAAVPTSVAYVGQISQGAANCPAGQSGFSREITLQVVDQNGNTDTIPWAPTP